MWIKIASKKNDDKEALKFKHLRKWVLEDIFCSRIFLHHLFAFASSADRSWHSICLKLNDSTKPKHLANYRPTKSSDIMNLVLNVFFGKLWQWNDWRCGCKAVWVDSFHVVKWQSIDQSEIQLWSQVMLEKNTGLTNPKFHDHFSHAGCKKLFANISITFRSNKLADQRLSMDNFAVASKLLFEFSPEINTKRLNRKMSSRHKQPRKILKRIHWKPISPNMLRASFDDVIIYLDLQRKQFIPFDIGYTSTAISVQVNPQLCAGMCLYVSHKNLFFFSLL